MKYFTPLLTAIIVLTVLCISIDLLSSNEVLQSYIRGIATGNITLIITLIVVEIYLKNIRAKAEKNIERKQNHNKVVMALKTLKISYDNLFIALKDLMCEHLPDFQNGSNSVEIEYTHLQYMYNHSLLPGYGFMNPKIKNFNSQFKKFQQKISQIIILTDFSHHPGLYDLLFQIYQYNENNSSVIDVFVDTRNIIEETNTINLIRGQTETPQPNDPRTFLALSGLLYNLIKFNFSTMEEINELNIT